LPPAVEGASLALERVEDVHGGLGDALDIVAQQLPVVLGAALVEPLPALPRPDIADDDVEVEVDLYSNL
jgi:hypothetical protein